MTPELAQLAAQFLARVDLKGNEAPAMVAVMQALSQIINSQKPTLVPDAPDEADTV